jgi:DNA-binding MarR family transcriptional regulator
MASIDDEVKTNFMNDRHRFVANLMFTSSWIRGLFVEFLKPFGISSQQFNILRILRGAGDWVSMNDVKRLMVEKSPNATRLVDKLLEKGLVERRRSEEDRRVVHINITKAGLDLLSGIDELGDGEHNVFLTRITDEEAKKINPILDRLRG